MNDRDQQAANDAQDRLAVRAEELMHEREEVLRAKIVDLEAKLATALHMRAVMFGMLTRRSRRESELRVREVESTVDLDRAWDVLHATYSKAPMGSAMRAVVDAAEALIRAQSRNVETMQREVVDARAIFGEAQDAFLDRVAASAPGGEASRG